MKRFLYLLISALLFNCIMGATMVYAEENTSIELSALNLNKGASSTVSGRIYYPDEMNVKLYGESADGKELIASGASDGNGVFSLTFTLSDKEYTGFELASGDFDDTYDLSYAAQLFNIGDGYDISQVMLEAEGFTLGGTHSGTAGGGVTLTATKKETNPVEIAAIAQSVSDENRAFALEFKLPDGQYELNLKAVGAQKAAGDLLLCDLPVDLCSESEFENSVLRLTGFAAELEALIDECAANNITTDYESAYVEIIKNQISIMHLEAEHDDYSRVEYYVYVLQSLYNETKQNLEMYLTGDKTPFAVPRYQTGEITIDGKSVIANTDTNSVIEERPVFFVGYGHWYTVGEEIPFFSSVGLNTIQTEIRMSDVFVAQPVESGRTQTQYDVEAEKLGFYINYGSIDWLRDVLERAEQYNVMVDVLLSPHYIPKFILNSDPDSTAHYAKFMPFALDNKTVRNAVGLWARLIASVVSEYDSCHTLCLANEPKVAAWSPVDGNLYYDAQWKDYLENKYTTIENLNKAYGQDDSSYENFDAVDMPQNIFPTPLYQDYRTFNETLFTEFHEWLSGVIKYEHPDLLLHTKMKGYFNHAYRTLANLGANHENMTGILDINGCDGFSFFEDRNKYPLTLKMGWYDYMTSVKDAPVWDTETHDLRDYRDINYDPIITDYIGTDIWNGAVHGRGATMLWIYDKSDTTMPWGEKTEYFSNTNAIFRPADVLEVSKTAMDLNRLSKEVSAIAEEEPKVGLLYSMTSLGYTARVSADEEHMTNVGEAYEDIIFSGQKVGFVTDTTPEDMHKYDLLVIPYATHIPENVLNCISEYEGEILILGTDSLKYDEMNSAHDTAVVNAIFAKSDTQSTVMDKIRAMNMSEVVLVDAATGEALDNVEWSYAEYNGKMIVNIVNYDMENDKDIKLYYNGVEIKNLTELRSGAKTDTGVLTAESVKPIFVSFDLLKLDLVDDNGNLLKENITALTEGNIRCTANIEGDVILALYKDDENGNHLLDVTVNEGEIKFAPTESGSYHLMATVWNVKTMEPLVKSIKLSAEVSK